jgi:hypothetical protein
MTSSEKNDKQNKLYIVYALFSVAFGGLVAFVVPALQQDIRLQAIPAVVLLCFLLFSKSAIKQRFDRWFESS